MNGDVHYRAPEMLVRLLERPCERALEVDWRRREVDQFDETQQMRNPRATCARNCGR